jgi:hypothetical protein
LILLRVHGSHSQARIMNTQSQQLEATSETPVAVTWGGT